MALADRDLKRHIVYWQNTGVPRVGGDFYPLESDTKSKLDILLDICRGIEEVGHEHRLDLKPSNILLHGGVWKLADVGSNSYAREYAAPELWRNEQPSVETYIYAVGCSIYHLMTGHPPFDDPGLQEKHLFQTPPALAGSRRLALLALTCLRKERHKRPTVGQLIDGLLEARNPDNELISAALEMESKEQEVHARRQCQRASSGFRRIGRGVSQFRQAERALREKEVQLLAAQSIQAHLLPDAPPAIAGFDVFGATYPAKSAGGDFFDYVNMPDGSVGFVIGDVSGHGFGSALLMASTRTHIRLLADSHLQIGEILAQTNTALDEEIIEGDFSTLLFTCLDTRARTLTYANAGHPPGYVLDYSGNVKARLESTSFPLGIQSDTEFPVVGPTLLDAGDVVVMLTDGVAEATSPEHELFGNERLLDLIRESRDKRASEIVENLLVSVREFAKREELDDDITVVVIKVRAE
jgi:serine phosphatase RsbU (regulator of sigma subunit)